MGQILSDNDRTMLDQQIADAEKRTKSQIVLAVVQKSDSYAELPWKAFALGASIAGLIVFILNLLTLPWNTNAMLLVSSASILGAGAVFSLLAVFIPGFAKLFLSNNRAETETRQYAESLFLDRELFATSGRTGILLLVSLFEHEVIIVPDKGPRNRLSIADMNDIIRHMTRLLKRKKLRQALKTGLEKITGILESSAPDISAKDELSNKIIEEKGV
ncbi:MAG: hypothetical protein JXN64_12710 [Spirochaetes bacterium]|nr:hypothetical protein [Spirochaetota bacterium]